MDRFNDQLETLKGDLPLTDKILSLLFIGGTIALEYVIQHPGSFLLMGVTLLWTYERYRTQKTIRKREELKLKNDERNIGSI
jgi:hypothetical protein